MTVFYNEGWANWFCLIPNQLDVMGSKVRLGTQTLSDAVCAEGRQQERAQGEKKEGRERANQKTQQGTDRM